MGAWRLVLVGIGTMRRLGIRIVVLIRVLAAIADRLVVVVILIVAIVNDNDNVVVRSAEEGKRG